MPEQTLVHPPARTYTNLVLRLPTISRYSLSQLMHNWRDVLAAIGGQLEGKGAIQLHWQDGFQHHGSAQRELVHDDKLDVGVRILWAFSESYSTNGSQSKHPSNGGQKIFCKAIGTVNNSNHDSAVRNFIGHSRVLWALCIAQNCIFVLPWV